MTLGKDNTIMSKKRAKKNLIIKREPTITFIGARRTEPLLT